MMALKDLHNSRFGRLVVLSLVGKSNRGRLWLCRCDCGNECRVATKQLSSGNTQSCGCLRRALSSARAIKRTRHGNAQRSGWSRTYSTWKAMRARCGNPKSTGYKNYGGRGIKVCDRWMNSFENFLADMGERPAGVSIDRADVNGNYEPGNCRWATPKEQHNNRANNRTVQYQGRAWTLALLADHAGLPASALHHRLFSLGWSLTDALTLPVQQRSKRPSLRGAQPRP